MSDSVQSWNCIPPNIRGGIARYLIFGIPGGSFLDALFRNDLRDSFGRADEINRKNMFNIVAFLYNFSPPREIIHPSHWLNVSREHRIDIMRQLVGSVFDQMIQEGGISEIAINDG